MNKKYLTLIILVSLGLLLTFLLIKIMVKPNNPDIKTFKGTVLGYDNNVLVVQDKNNILTFKGCLKEDLADQVIIKYSGLDEDMVIKDCEFQTTNKDITIPKEYEDDGIFSLFYKLAYDKLQSLSLEEKIGQLLLVRYPNNALAELNKYHFSGFVFYEKDFQNKNEYEVQTMLKDLQKKANVPLLMAVDEEGGKVVRLSSNPKLVSSPFASPSELYNAGGFTKIKEDTINKSKILKNLGLNVNLAPVVDVSENHNDYIYERTLKKGVNEVATYAKTVIEASKNTSVSYVLKHFPGYGNTIDTHYGVATNDTAYTEVQKNYLPPFASGIESGAEAVLVGHQIMNSIDEDNPASLSIKTHNLLKDDLKFSGVTISDDLEMGAVSALEDVEQKALLAGNDLLITTDYEKSYRNIQDGLANNKITPALINKAAFKVLAWKYYKGLMFEEK